MNDVNVVKVGGGLGRLTPSTDGVSAIIANAVAAGSFVLGDVYTFRRIEDVTAIGIDAAYDAANNILVYEHLKEAFRINPNIVIWFMGVAQTVLYKDMVDPTNASGAKKLLIAAGGEVNQLAVAYNPTTPVTTTAALLLAIPKAQLLADAEYISHRPLHILLEGAGFDSASFTSYHGLAAPSVSVFVGQDSTVASANVAFNRYAAIGTLLGAVSLAAVNVNIAWVQNFNLLGDTLVDWAVKNVPSIGVTETIQDNIAAAGLISFRNHANRTGIYFTDSFTCAELTDDYAYIESNRTANKATKLIRAALLPYLNAPITVDTVTGKIDIAEISAMQSAGRKAIDENMKNELSGFTFTIDPDQNILSTSLLETELSLVPTGTARNINVKLGFSNPLNS